MNISFEQLKEIDKLRQNIETNGWKGVAVETGGKAPVGYNWNGLNGPNRPALIPTQPNSASTGILTERTRTLDLDIDYKEAVETARQIVEEEAGTSPLVRFRSNSFRIAMVYGAPPDANANKKGFIRLDKLEPTIDEKGKEHKQQVEILADGQQLVAFGIHPSGVDYEWEGATPANFHRDALPILTKEKEEAIRKRLEAEFCFPPDEEPEEVHVEPSSDMGVMAHAFLDKQVNALSNAPGGQRNDTVYKCGIAVGNYIGAKLLDEELATEALLNAIRSWGVGADKEEKTLNTLKNSISRGKAKPAKLRMTVNHKNVADAWAESNSHRVRYCHQTKAWFVWDDVRWTQDIQKDVYGDIANFTKDFAKTYGGKSDIKPAGSDAFIRGVESVATSIKSIKTDGRIWDPNDYLLGTPGGTVDLRTGELRKSDQNDFITKLTPVAPSPKADCPLWLRVLHEATAGDEEFIETLQQFFGMFLTGDISEQLILFIYGDGGTSKSVVAHVAYTMLGDDYAHIANMDSFTASYGDKHPTDLASLRGKRLVVAHETKPDRHWDENRLKIISGEKAITARKMRQDEQTFKIKCKLFFTGNNKPGLKGVDYSWRRRFQLAPFEVRVEEEKKDKRLTDKLEKELPEILRWAIEGCVKLLKAEKLSIAKCIETASSEYFDDQDHYAEWFEENCTLDQNKKLNNGELFGSWKKFAEENNYIIGDTTKLTNYLRKKYMDKIKCSHTGGKKHIKGIDFKM